MGKYMRKGKVVGDSVALMDVTQQASMGVRTRARTKLALAQNNSASEQAAAEAAAAAAAAAAAEEEEEEEEAGGEEEEKVEAEEEETASPPPRHTPRRKEKQKQKSVNSSSCYQLRSGSRKAESAAAASEKEELGRPKRNKGKDARLSRLRAADGAQRNSLSQGEGSNPPGPQGGEAEEVEAEAEAGGGSGASARQLRNTVKKKKGGGGSRKRKANSRNNTVSNNKAAKVSVVEAEEPGAAAAPAEGARLVGAMEVAGGNLFEQQQQREGGDGDDASGSQEDVKSVEVEASFGDNAFGDYGMEQDRYSGKDESRNVRESTPSSYSREQEGEDAPEACSRQPTPRPQQVEHALRDPPPPPPPPSSSSVRRQPPNANRRLFEAPSASELHDFFTQAEHREHRRFAHRYNFDPVNDVPLAGRYEWMKVVTEEEQGKGQHHPEGPAV